MPKKTFYCATKNFHPKSKATYVILDREKHPTVNLYKGELVCVKNTENNKIEYYNPSMHNDSSTETGIKKNYELLYCTDNQKIYLNSQKFQGAIQKKSAQKELIEIAVSDGSQSKHLTKKQKTFILADGFDITADPKTYKIGQNLKNDELIVVLREKKHGAYVAFDPDIHTDKSMADILCVKMSAYKMSKSRARKKLTEKGLEVKTMTEGATTNNITPTINPDTGTSAHNTSIYNNPAVMFSQSISKEEIRGLMNKFTAYGYSIAGPISRG